MHWFYLALDSTQYWGLVNSVIKLELSSGTVFTIASFQNVSLVGARKWLKADQKN